MPWRTPSGIEGRYLLPTTKVWVLEDRQPFLELLLVVEHLRQRQGGLGPGTRPFVPGRDLPQVRDSLRQVPRRRRLPSLKVGGLGPLSLDRLRALVEPETADDDRESDNGPCDFALVEHDPLGEGLFVRAVPLACRSIRCRHSLWVDLKW